MAEDILNRWSNLKIAEEEEQIVAFDDNHEGLVDPSIGLAVVGKIMTVRPYNFEAFKRTMNQIWAISKDALFRSIEHGLFVVQFPTLRDKKKIMEGRPWTFDQNLVVLNEIEGGVQPSDIALNRCPFWVRFYNLPLDSRSVNHIRKIGAASGKLWRWMRMASSGILLLGLELLWISLSHYDASNVYSIVVGQWFQLKLNMNGSLLFVTFVV